MATATLTDSHRDAFFAARGTQETIEALYDLHMFASAGHWERSDLSMAAAQLADENDWDTDGSLPALLDAITDYARELPLSVLVRSDWHSPGSDFEPAQFELLLATGGPGVRIVGELDHRREPYRPQLQYQDWGIPWTDHPESKIDYLEWFAGLFWYGD